MEELILDGVSFCKLTMDEKQEHMYGFDVRFLYRDVDMGKEMFGLLMIDDSIVPCAYESSGNTYEPDYLVFGDIKVPCAPNGKTVFYVDYDNFIIDNGHAELVLHISSISVDEASFKTADDILKLSRVEIKVDCSKKRAKVAYYTQNNESEKECELECSLL